MDTTSCEPEAVPRGVFYVVETIGSVLGTPRHLVRSPLYESGQQAVAEIKH